MSGASSTARSPQSESTAAPAGRMSPHSVQNDEIAGFDEDAARHRRRIGRLHDLRARIPDGSRLRRRRGHARPDAGTRGRPAVARLSALRRCPATPTSRSSSWCSRCRTRTCSAARPATSAAPRRSSSSSAFRTFTLGSRSVGPQRRVRPRSVAVQVRRRPDTCRPCARWRRTRGDRAGPVR